jgi:hypothetical protein
MPSRDQRAICAAARLASPPRGCGTRCASRASRNSGDETVRTELLKTVNAVPPRACRPRRAGHERAMKRLSAPKTTVHAESRPYRENDDLQPVTMIWSFTMMYVNDPLGAVLHLGVVRQAGKPAPSGSAWSVEGRAERRPIWAWSAIDAWGKGSEGERVVAMPAGRWRHALGGTEGMGRLPTAAEVARRLGYSEPYGGWGARVCFRGSRCPAGSTCGSARATWSGSCGRAGRPRGCRS